MDSPPSRWARGRAFARAQRARADRLGKRAHAERENHASVDTAFEMVELDGETGGGIIAGALAYRFFVWLLPLALVLTAGLGFAADATSKSPEEAAGSFGLAGLVSTSVASAADGEGRWYALLVGIPILVYVTRGLLRALIGAHRLVWGEPRSATVKPTIRASLVLLLYLLTFMFATAVMNWARSTYGSLGALGLILGFLIYGVLWLFVTLDLPHKDASWNALVPGALLFAAGLTVLQAVMLYILTPYVLNKGGTYGSLGIAAGLLFSLYLVSRLMIASAVVNATLWRRGLVLGRA
jgi:uncharacterized BrkB/YihY/UPF0761 family membrane protein